MGDIAVDVFLKTLKQLITSSKLSLIISEKNQLQSLEEEIKYLREFLKVTEKKRNDHSELMELVMQIRDLVSEAENIVELFVVHAFKVDELASAFKKGLKILTTIMKKIFSKNIVASPLSLDLGNVKKGLKILMIVVKKIYDENNFDISGVAVKQLKHSSAESGGSSGGSNASKVVKQKVVVGFEEEIEKLIDKLDDKGEGRPLEIISIIGAGGGGKTTLAREVYDHCFTSYTFDIRVWIDVSQDYDKTKKRDLLISILESAILKKQEDYGKFSDDQLGEKVLKCLKGRKYLIVMDDIWGIEAWNDIQRSFPKERKGSKVMFTSRLLVELDCVGYVPHYLAPLPTNWCWELLQKKVFGMEPCPPELADIGEQIAEKCDGLPLAVVAIGGILATEEKTLDVWKKVAKHLSSIIAKNQEGCMEILELSYNHLPLHLKACLLYIGGYPEDIEIPTCELIQLWIAEGFIQQSDGGKSLETIAKDYLIGLIDRSLVQVAWKSPLGGIKACRIHDLLRELCLKKAKDDNFFLKVYENDSFSPSATNKHRRLFIGLQFFEEFSFSSRPQNLRSLRSFLCLSSNYSIKFYKPQLRTNFSFFAENFELVRVLSFISIAPYRGKKVLVDLVHLRYLAYAVDFCDALPFTYLLNLQTLNIFTSMDGGTIWLPLDIFKMVNLRHLYTKGGVFTFHHFSEEAGSIGFDCSSKLDSLQTLHRICACEVCRRLLVRTPNLRKLGLHRWSREKGNVLSFPDIEFLNCLEKLTFTMASHSYSTVGRSTLPPGLKLPLTITQITMKHTCLKWEELSLLQALPSLEVLKLINNACIGAVWDIGELEGFPELKYLRFSNLDIKEWNASEDQFPKLEVLEIDCCYKLEQIPIDFANLYELREIKLLNCRSSAEESAREIQEEQRNKKGDDDCLILLTYSNDDSDSD